MGYHLPVGAGLRHPGDIASPERTLRPERFDHLAQRAFWGSDITRVPQTCSYRQVVTHFTEELDFLSAGDLEWIMGRGLAACLRWPEPRT